MNTFDDLENDLTDYLAQVIDCYNEFAETVSSLLNDDQAEELKDDKERLFLIGVYVDHLEDDLDKAYEEFQQADEEFEKRYSMKIKFKRPKYF